MSNSNGSRSTLLARDAAAIAGILKRLQNVPSIVLGGATYSPTTLVGLLQSHMDAAKKVESDKGQYQAAIEAFRALSKIVHNVLLGLRDFVRQMFNNAPDALSDFGFAPKKVAKRSAVKRVVAVEKNRATRAARGTVGPKKKLATKGTVTPSQIAQAVAEALGPEGSAPVATSGSSGTGNAAHAPSASPASPPATPPAAPAQGGSSGNGPHA